MLSVVLQVKMPNIFWLQFLHCEDFLICISDHIEMNLLSFGLLVGQYKAEMSRWMMHIFHYFRLFFGSNNCSFVQENNQKCNR